MGYIPDPLDYVPVLPTGNTYLAPRALRETLCATNLRMIRLRADIKLSHRGDGCEHLVNANE